MSFRKPIEVGIFGLLLGAGCGWCWYAVAGYEQYTCGLISDSDEFKHGVCMLSKEIAYPVAALVTAGLSLWLTWWVLASTGARKWSYPDKTVVWLVLAAALTYHSIPVGKIPVATGMVGVGLGLAMLAEQRRKSPSAEPGC